MAYNVCVICGLLVLLTHQFRVDAANLNKHHVIMKLDYSGVRGSSEPGELVNSWVPPPLPSLPGSGFLCTKSSFPDQDAYCVFDHYYENTTWANIFVSTSHKTVKTAKCVTRFDRIDPHGDFGVAEEMVTFSHNSTMCYGTNGGRLSNFLLHFMRNSSTLARLLPGVDELRFAMGDVDYLMLEGYSNAYCKENIFFRSGRFGLADGEQVGEDAVYFPWEFARGYCGLVAGRQSSTETCRIDSRGRCRPEE